MANALMLIRDARRLNGKSLQEVSSEAGVHFTTWAKWERGRVPAVRVLDVERITGIPREELRPDLFARPNPEAANV
ncbi:hypothetical protein Tasa_041_018 [Tanticharoenia sakaeratensis NBRC 103193]|uniref:HTH cro/C1-type domain-containing protein n=1 Tax=Tanticharoenia sakaeratensis NBRC 103193 TaxID=1231623 RepID=A0A0D6MPJ6_9PROT|nr:hypothetical protein Tasa_041_018 [Tanticharoenia sakaeratensis NBRC 103193]GBQ23286.1 hypothetical protein AA103193_2361 [Tanticharoenia sakaeratensis NBRC 103193]